MATKPETNFVNGTVWTSSMRMDFTSDGAGACSLLFRTLDAQDARSAVLKELHEIDAEMTANAMTAAVKDLSA